MKYALTINLEALFKLVQSYTYNEAAILDYLYFICTSPDEKMVRLEDGSTWIDYQHLLNNLPFLSFTSAPSVSRAINVLEKDGFIIVNHGERDKTFVKLLPKIMKLYIKPTKQI